MCREVDPEKPQCILELGAGTGPVTEVIRSRMHPDSHIIAVEIDPELHAIVSRRCPDVDVVLGSAGDIDDILDERDIEAADCIVSCLPVPSLPKEVNRSIFDAWSRRCRSEVFTQITQIPWYFMPMYQRLFHDVEFQLITMNLPPAGVYHCSNLRSDYAAPERLAGK